MRFRPLIMPMSPHLAAVDLIIREASEYQYQVGTTFKLYDDM